MPASDPREVPPRHRSGPRRATPSGGSLRRGVLVAAFALFSVTAAAQPHVLVQAHRGYSEIYPENTLLAIERAFDAGADRVETDLALSADGHVVLMHDRTVDRTTDGSGRVASLDLAELKSLDAGSWKDPRFAGEPVPTLAEALDLAEGRGELNLEIKSNDRSLLEVIDTVEAAVRVVQEHDAGERVVFSSFDFRALDEVREHDPDLRVLVIDWSEGGRGSGLQIALDRGYYGVALAADFATPERLHRAEEAGLFVHIGTRPEPAILDWVEQGVDGFSANDPQALVEYLEQHGLRR